MEEMILEYVYKDGDVGAYYVNELDEVEKHLWENVFQFYFNQFDNKRFPAPQKLSLRFETEEEKSFRLKTKNEQPN